MTFLKKRYCLSCVIIVSTFFYLFISVRFAAIFAMWQYQSSFNYHKFASFQKHFQWHTLIVLYLRMSLKMYRRMYEVTCMYFFPYVDFDTSAIVNNGRILCWTSRRSMQNWILYEKLIALTKILLVNICVKLACFVFDLKLERRYRNNYLQ